MDLIKINYKPCEVPPSKQKRMSLNATRCLTMSAFQTAYDKITKEAQAQGFTLFALEWTTIEHDDGESSIVCMVRCTRMESPEELTDRVKSQEAYNARQIKEHEDKVLASKRNKEIKRLTEGFTLEQLQALPGLGKLVQD